VSGEIFKTKNTVDESPFDNNTWRWVRERGPLLIEEGKDGRRPGNKWGLFMQYAKSSEVAMHEDDLGRREMVMVDPLIRSRRGCFDGESCQSEFRAAFLLHQNLKAAERWRLGRSDGISPSDLQAIYPGKTINELERMLGAMLGEIRYGKFLPSRQRRVLADEMRQGESFVGGGAEVVATVEVRAQKETGKNKRGQTWVKVVSASGIVLVLASACTRVLPTTPMATDAVRPTEQANLPTTGPEDTIEPTPTPAIQITPTYSVEAAGGQYTETQLALNNSESAIKQKAVIERWLEYWGNFNNRPFDPETVELKWKYIYDDPNNPTNVFLMLEAGGEYNGRLFTVPIGADGKFVDFPPEVSGQDIQPGFGPLELSAGGEGMWLSVNENGIPVRRDGTGTIVQTLNMETRQWENVVVIDFEIPAAPAGVDSDMWKTTYIHMMTEKPRIKNLVGAGQMVLQWNPELGTVVGSYGEETFAYNQEFGFTGEVVKDTFGRSWIVREKLTMSQGDTTTVWNFDQLHVPNSSQLVMGIDSRLVEYGEQVAIVGQVVGTERVDFSPYLSSTFSSLSEADQGIFYEGKNLVYEVVVVRVPTSNGFADLRVPVCPVDYCNDPEIRINFLRGPTGSFMTGEKILEGVDLGSMIYVFNVNFTNESIPRSYFISQYEEYSVGLAGSRAFGNGDLLYSTLTKHTGYDELSGQYVSDIKGIESIFNIEMLAADRFLPVLGAALFSR